MNYQIDQFSFQLSLQQLHLNLHFIPFKLKFVLKYNTTNIQSKSIAIKRKTTLISEIFCFDCELSYKKTREKKGNIYLQKMIQIKLIGNKAKQNFEIGSCVLNLADYANRNSFYYQNQIKLPIQKCKDQNANLLLVFKLNKLDYNIDEQKSSMAFSIPKIEPLSFLQNRKVLAVSRLIQIEDVGESYNTSKTDKTNKSNKTFPQYHQQDQQQFKCPDNLRLAQKLSSLYYHLQSLTDLSPPHINGIQIIKQSPQQLIQSSVISSRNIESRYKQQSNNQIQSRDRYSQLIKHLGNIAENKFEFAEIQSSGGEQVTYSEQQSSIQSK